MTWKQNLAEANWIQLGYVAANVASLLVPLCEERAVTLTNRDHGMLLQQADLFDAALVGWKSFEQPGLLFQKPANAFEYPAGALEILTEVYAAVQGSSILDPARFRNDLREFTDLLKKLADTESLSDMDKAICSRLVVFLRAMIDRARAEMHRAVTTSR